MVGRALGAGTGVEASTGAYNGLAGQFTNVAKGSGGEVGTAVRAVAGSGVYAQLRVSLPATATAGYGAGEFVGEYGVIGAASGDGPQAAGVLGIGAGTTGHAHFGYGVIGHGLAGDQAGVLGTCPQGTGVRGVADRFGVVGLASARFGIGVQGAAAGSGSVGVVAVGSSDTTGTAKALSAQGDVDVTGTLTKGGGSFRIDHPLDPAGKYLSHSFVESPDMKNVYDGVVSLDRSGVATVQLPDWFGALNRDLRYQLTALDGPAPDLHVARRVTGGSFGIAGGQPGQQVCWQVTGTRQDAWAQAHRIVVEQDKPAEEQDRFLHPELQPGGAAAPLPLYERVRAASVSR